MITKTRATLEDLYATPGKAELVNGELALMSSTGGILGFAGDDIFFPDVLVFAAEVRNENNYGPKAEEDMAAQRANDFVAGGQVVWDVDLLSEDVVRVYRADASDTPTIYQRGETAEARPAVPGWTMPVDDVFE
jgi:Uma2 family endonuclease